MNTTTQRPTCAPPIIDTIPASLKAERRWVCWRYEWKKKERCWAKVPIDTQTGKWQTWADPNTWLTFDVAVAAFRRGRMSGIGFILGDGWAGVDQDDHLDSATEKTDTFATSMLARLNSYSEIWPSGAGLKTIVRATFDRGHIDHVSGIEVYGPGRFFTVTGRRLTDYSAAVENRQEEVTTLLSELGAAKKAKPKKVKPHAAAEPHRNGTPTDRETALAALNVLASARADGYQDWLTVGMALHSVDTSLLGEWDQWSRQSNKYTAGGCAEKWQTLSAEAGGVGIGSLCHWADQDSPGWREQYRRNGATHHPPGVGVRRSAVGAKEGGVLSAVVLPGGSTTISEAGARFGDLLTATKKFYRRGDSVSELMQDKDRQPILRVVKPAGLASALESVARLVVIKTIKGEVVDVPTTCSETTARLILNAREFLNRLPPIHVLAPCPVIIERDGQLVLIVGYDRESGVLAAGEPPLEIRLDEARQLLDEITSDFRYTAPADRARHLAAVITPALVLGGLLGGRAPVDLSEANESQAGKGYKNKITAAIYGMKPRTITQRKSGVEGIEESFSGALMAGAPIISLDNIRGKVDLPAIESFLTEDTYQARVPYSGDVEIDARRIILMMTSNKAEITPDLADRAGITRILKQPDGYQFCQFAEGDILDHVRANQARYLGAVFAIVRAWHAAGKPRTTETRHDFRRWATTLDWIGQHLLLCPPLLDGHRETQRRMATPALNWLRDVALAVARAGRMGQWLRTYELLDIAETADLEIPGVNEDTNLDDDTTRVKVLREIGKRLGRCFIDDQAIIDDMMIQRRQTCDHEFRPRPEYQFGEKCKNTENPAYPE